MTNPSTPAVEQGPIEFEHNGPRYVLFARQVSLDNYSGRLATASDLIAALLAMSPDNRIAVMQAMPDKSLAVEERKRAEAAESELASVRRERDEAYALLEDEQKSTAELLDAAWEATGVASTVRGLTTLDDVIRVQRAELASVRRVAEERGAALTELERVIRLGSRAGCRPFDGAVDHARSVLGIAAPPIQTSPFQQVAQASAEPYECNCPAPYKEAVHDLTCPEHLKRFPADGLDAAKEAVGKENLDLFAEGTTWHVNADRGILLDVLGVDRGAGFDGEDVVRYRYTATGAAHELSLKHFWATFSPEQIATPAAAKEAAGKVEQRDSDICDRETFVRMTMAVSSNVAVLAHQLLLRIERLERGGK